MPDVDFRALSLGQMWRVGREKGKVGFGGQGGVGGTSSVLIKTKHCIALCFYPRSSHVQCRAKRQPIRNVKVIFIS